MFDYTAQQITEILSRHEKSLISRTEEDRLRVLNNPNLASFRADLDKCLEHYMAKPLYAIPFSVFRRFEDDGDRTQFEFDPEKGYFTVRGHLESKVIGAWLYPEREDILVALQDTIWAICDEYTWSLPACLSGNEALRANLQEDSYTVDLFAAETADTLAEALMLLGDRLDPIVIKRVQRELKKRVIDRFETGNFHWLNGRSNWAAVCGGSIGMACMCEIDDNERLGRLLEKVMISMRSFVDSFSDDGACLEGSGYWSYGFGYFSCFADTLYKRTGGEINLFAEPRIHDIALFPQKCCFYGNRGVSFSDSGSSMSLNLGLTHMLSHHYSDMFVPEGVRLVCGIGIGGCHRFARTIRDALWAPDGEIKRTPPESCYMLPAAQWYIASGKDNVGVAAKGGHNAEPHNHNDIGNFLIYKNGVEIISDLGSGEYTKKYFSRERYQLANCGSQGHCVPVIGGLYQHEGAQYRAADFSIDESGVRMDIAPAYGLGDGNSVIREIRFDKDAGQLTVSDSFSLSEAPKDIIERFVSRIQPKQTDDGVVFGNEVASMKLKLTSGKAEAKIYSGTEMGHGGQPFTVWYTDYVFDAPGANVKYVFELK